MDRMSRGKRWMENAFTVHFTEQTLSESLECGKGSVRRMRLEPNADNAYRVEFGNDRTRVQVDYYEEDGRFFPGVGRRVVEDGRDVAFGHTF